MSAAVKAGDELRKVRMPAECEREVVARMEADASLWKAEAVRGRLDALDELDAFRDQGTGGQASEAVRARLETANTAVYEGIRREPERMRTWIANEAVVTPGLGYDWRDELVSGVLALREPESVKALEDDMVFYQPTPVRHVVDLIERAGISENDTVVDLGSGLGHVPLLVGMLTEARSVGIEVEGAYLACARECAERLGLSKRVRFVEGDARRADLAAGTVFYLYTPFTGGMLGEMLRRLREEGTRKAMRVCTLGPCTEVVARERWLRACGAVDAGRVTVFASR